MEYPQGNDQKVKDREKFFLDTLADYTEHAFENDLNIIKETVKEQFKIEVAFEVSIEPHIHRTINNLYWSIINDHVKPKLIQKEGGIPPKVDVYKILSVTEYAIIASQPFSCLFEGHFVDTLSNGHPAKEGLLKIQKLINAYYATYAAINFIALWDGPYKKAFNDPSVLEKICSLKEASDKRKTAMDILTEHRWILAFSSNAENPIFINSIWWRLYCLIATMEHEKTK